VRKDPSETKNETTGVKLKNLSSEGQKSEDSWSTEEISVN